MIFFSYFILFIFKIFAPQRVAKFYAINKLDGNAFFGNDDAFGKFLECVNYIKANFLL